MVNSGLLWAGIAAVVVHALGDVVAGVVYEGYSFRDQAVSELSAFGSPVRPLMTTVILVHGALLVAFGVGCTSSRRSPQPALGRRAADCRLLGSSSLPRS